MTRTLRLVDDPAPEGERPLRIAVATNDLEHLNAHFGSARKFAIYDVTPTEARFVGAAGFDDVTGQAGKHDDIDDKITPKVEALQGCALLFVLAIGGPSAAKAGIHPVKRKDLGPISEIIAETQEMLQGSPPPFLRKILGRDAPKPSFMDDEEYAR